MYSISHRALVTYSDYQTGEIRVKIPAVSGASEVSISYIGRKPRNGIWIVPEIGDQIIVSADDPNMTNIFWLRTGDDMDTFRYRNYGEFLKTDTQPYSITVAGKNFVSFDTKVYEKGIRLVTPTQFVFDYTGVYNMQFSLQWENTDSQIRDAAIWVEYNGSPYPNSATYTHIPSSHGGIPGSAVTTVNIIGETNAGGSVRLAFLASDPSVRLSTILPTSGVLPNYGQPASPAVILTFTQVA